MKTTAAIVLVLICVAFALPCAADDAKQGESMGQKIGSMGRQIVDESKKTFHDIKETGKKIYHGAKKEAQEAKENAKALPKDVKSGLKNGGHAKEAPKMSGDH